MTTFQSIIYGLIQGFSELLPLGGKPHLQLVPDALGWPTPSGVFLGTLSLASLLAVFFYFLHDWASMIASTLQVVIYRKRPMTVDERLPLFLLVSFVPTLAAWKYFQDHDPLWSISTSAHAAIYVAVGLCLLALDHFSRHNKGIVDLSWKDAALMGLLQAAMFLPGADHITTILIASAILNYRREAAAKYSILCSFPILLGSTILNLRGLSFKDAQPMADLSWLSLAVGFVVALLSTLLFVGAMMKHLQRKGYGQYMVYRVVLAVAIAGSIWYRSRG